MRVYRRTILSVCNPLINWKSHRRHGLVYGGKVIATTKVGYKELFTQNSFLFHAYLRE